MEATAARRFAIVAGKHRLLLCPFYARKPFEYWQVSECAGRGWTLSELKAHLYRHHSTEYLCPNGCKGFKSKAELDKHSATENPCSNCCRAFKSKNELDNHMATSQTCVRRTPEIEGFKEEIRRKIQDRTHPPGHRRMTREEEDVFGWNKIYRFIFPDIDDLFYPPSPFYDERLLIHRNKVGRELAWVRVERGEQEWERIVDSFMVIAFPNTAMAAAAAAPGPSMVASYPDSSHGGGDAADGAEDPADPLVRDGEDRETAVARDTLAVGDYFGHDKPSIAPDPILLSRRGALVNEDIPGLIRDTALTLIPFMTGSLAAEIDQPLHDVFMGAESHGDTTGHAYGRCG